MRRSASIAQQIHAEGPRRERVRWSLLRLIEISKIGRPLRIEVEQETDGRFVPEVPDLPGVMAYGQSRDEAIVKVEALALRVLLAADRMARHAARESHRVLVKEGRPNFVFAFHDGEEIGPKMRAPM